MLVRENSRLDAVFEGSHDDPVENEIPQGTVKNKDEDGGDENMWDG